jgi:Fe2+ or Zn2+ uptake regulation protein
MRDSDLSKSEVKKLSPIQKIIGCNLRDCGQYIELHIDEQMNRLIEKQRKYTGSCSKCGKHFKINHSQLSALKKAVGTPTIVIKKTTFDIFFEENE